MSDDKKETVAGQFSGNASADQDGVKTNTAGVGDHITRRAGWIGNIRAVTGSHAPGLPDRNFGGSSFLLDLQRQLG